MTEKSTHYSLLIFAGVVIGRRNKNSSCPVSKRAGFVEYTNQALSVESSVNTFLYFPCSMLPSFYQDVYVSHQIFQISFESSEFDTNNMEQYLCIF